MRTNTRQLFSHTITQLQTHFSMHWPALFQCCSPLCLLFAASWEFAGSSRGRGRGSVPARGRGVGRGRGRGRGRGLTSESTSETSSAERYLAHFFLQRSLVWCLRLLATVVLAIHSCWGCGTQFQRRFVSCQVHDVGESQPTMFVLIDLCGWTDDISGGGGGGGVVVVGGGGS